MIIRCATPADAESMARLHVDTWRTTYAGIVPDSYLQGLSYDERAAMWRRITTAAVERAHTYVAEVGGSVVGFTSGGPKRSGTLPFAGEIYALYLRADLHRRGIGRALFRASVARLAADGFTNFMLWVLADNPSCGFYQHMGGRVVATQDETLGGKSLREKAYGWEALPAGDWQLRRLATASPAEQEAGLAGLVERSPLLQAVLAASERLALPHYFVGAGCLTQTVWNALSGFPARQGIKDVDLAYFDPMEQGADCEGAHTAALVAALPDVGLAFDVKNQARVHLWHEGKFGYPIEPYASVEAAIDAWPTTVTAIGIRKEAGRLRVYAPFGLSDLFAMVARPNQVQVTAQIYRDKVARWRAWWPSLRIEPWR